MDSCCKNCCGLHIIVTWLQLTCSETVCGCFAIERVQYSAPVVAGAAMLGELPRSGVGKPSDVDCVKSIDGLRDKWTN